MYRRSYKKPDGRNLILFGRRPLPADLAIPAPPGSAPPTPHLRWHPLRGEWVAYASHRQTRTYLPPAAYDPLAPTTDPENPTEVPAGPWDVAVFENRFPTLSLAAPEPPAEIVETRPGKGVCEVVVFTQSATGSLGALPLWHLELLLEAWADRQRELGALEDVRYVFPFENRGVEVGVTLPHPHGQIYAYPFVPPLAARELALQEAHFQRTGRGLLQDHLEAELREGTRLVYRGPEAVSLVPVCARYAYELWVAPLRPVPSLVELTASERGDFARALKTTLSKLDGLWQRPMPYLLGFHQAPTDGRAHPEAHLHLEIYPALRMPDRLKYLAGSEIGAGVFTADTLPDEKAAELRAVEVQLA